MTKTKLSLLILFFISYVNNQNLLKQVRGIITFYIKVKLPNLLTFVFFQPTTLEQNVQRLTELTENDSVIKLDSLMFREFVQSNIRNYSIVLLFTDIDDGSCPICPLMVREFQVVADSYRAVSSTFSNKLFFALIDNEDNDNILQFYQIESIPTLMHFPQHVSSNQDEDILKIQPMGISAEFIAKWINDRTGIDIVVQKPSELFENVALIVMSLMFVYYLYNRIFASSSLSIRDAFAVVLVMFCISMVSGNAWNFINLPPFLLKHQEMGIVAVHPSPLEQLWIETYVVMILCEMSIYIDYFVFKYYMLLIIYVFFVDGMYTIGFILMIESKPKGSLPMARVKAAVGVVWVFVFFSMILAMARQKSKVYPFRYLIKTIF